MSKIAIRRLLTGIVDLYRSEVAAMSPVSPMLSGALQAIAATPYPRDAMRGGEAIAAATPPPARTTPPVAGLVASLVASQPADGPLAEIVRRFRDAEPLLDWQQSPNYDAARMGQGFADRFGTIEIVGPQHVFKSPGTRVGFLLLGPEVHFPDHCHPAEEVVHVLAGTAEWWNEGEDWTAVPPGAALHHPPMHRHAVRTGAEPLLALYCWRGDVSVESDLTATQRKPGKAPAAAKSAKATSKGGARAGGKGTGRKRTTQ